MISVKLARLIQDFVKEWDPYGYKDEYMEDDERAFADILCSDSDFLIELLTDWKFESNDEIEMNEIDEILKEIEKETKKAA